MEIIHRPILVYLVYNISKHELSPSSGGKLLSLAQSMEHVPASKAISCFIFVYDRNIEGR
jgi:hypothetical protein